MKLNRDAAVRKLRKLRRDPQAFFRDMLRRRLGDLTPQAPPVTAESQRMFDTSDYDIVDGVAMVTQPELVRLLTELKQRPQRTVFAVSWWT